MKTTLLSLLALLSASVACAQGITFKSRAKIYLNGNSNFPIQYSGTKQTLEEVSTIQYNASGQKIATTKTVKKDWVPGTDASFDSNDFPNGTIPDFLYADLAQSDDKTKVYVHFYHFIDPQNGSSTKTPTKFKDGFNDKIKNGSFYFKLEEGQRLAVRTESYHAGPITIPFKVYLSSRDESHNSNASADFNAGLFIGRKWGMTSYGNLPAEKTAKTHETYVSANFLAGFSIIEVDAKNSINGSTVEGKSLSFGPGFGMGFHYDSFGIFLGAGIDIPMSNSTAKEWRYKNQPWLGFGIGFGLFK